MSGDEGRNRPLRERSLGHKRAKSMQDRRGCGGRAPLGVGSGATLAAGPETGEPSAFHLFFLFLFCDIGAYVLPVLHLPRLLLFLLTFFSPPMLPCNRRARVRTADAALRCHKRTREVRAKNYLQYLVPIHQYGQHVCVCVCVCKSNIGRSRSCSAICRSSVVVRRLGMGEDCRSRDSLRCSSASTSN